MRTKATIARMIQMTLSRRLSSTSSRPKKSNHSVWALQAGRLLRNPSRLWKLRRRLPSGWGNKISPPVHSSKHLCSLQCLQTSATRVARRLLITKSAMLSQVVMTWTTCLSYSARNRKQTSLREPRLWITSLCTWVERSSATTCADQMSLIRARRRKWRALRIQWERKRDSRLSRSRRPLATQTSAWLRRYGAVGALTRFLTIQSSVSRTSSTIKIIARQYSALWMKMGPTSAAWLRKVRSVTHQQQVFPPSRPRKARISANASWSRNRKEVARYQAWWV